MAKQQAREWFEKLSARTLDQGLITKTNPPLGEDITFTPSQSLILTLGGKFIPTPPPSDFRLAQFTAETHTFFRRLRLRALFAPERKNDPLLDSAPIPLPKLPLLPSTFNPEFHKDYRFKQHLVEPYIRKTRRLLFNAINEATTNTQFVKIKKRSNISSASRKALRTLSHHPRLIFRYADKNLGLTAIARDLYESAAMNILADGSTYEEQTTSLQLRLTMLRAQIIQLLQGSDAKHFLEERARKWAIKNTRDSKLTTPAFTILPKLHKQPVGWRPIVCAHSFITTPISTIAGAFLNTHAVSRCHTIIKDSNTLLRRLNSLKLDKDKQYTLAAVDIVNFYPSIPIDEGLSTVQAVTNTADTVGIITKPAPWIQFIMKLSKAVLHNNYLHFKGIAYRQRKGTAMGTNLAPPFANLYAAAMEQDLFGKLIWYDHTAHAQDPDFDLATTRDLASTSFVTHAS